MAKFCTKCGKQIEEGKTCNCISVEPVVAQNATVSTNNTKTNDIINSLMDIAKGIFVKPIDTIRKYTDDNNMVLGLILIAINALITGVMGYLLAKESMGLISSLMGFGSLLALGGSTIEVPFFQIAGSIFLIMAVFFVVLGFTSYVVSSKLFKTDTTWKKALVSVGVCSMLTSITSVAAIICIYVSMSVFAIVVSLAAILFLGYYYHSIKISSNIEENKQGYVFVSAIAVACFIAVYVLPKILF